MGIRKGDVITDDAAPTSNWGGQHLNGDRSGAARMLLSSGSGAMGSAVPTRRAWPPSEVWTAARPYLSWLQLLIPGAASILVLAFLHPVAYSVPTLRPTLETGITMLAVTAAWLVRAQFAHERRVRDLLLFGALLTLALIEFSAFALPAALHVRSDRGFIAVLPLGLLIVAATFAVAAFTQSDRLMTGGRHPLAATALLALVAAGVAELFGLLLSGQVVVAGKHSGAWIHAGLHHPLALVVVLGAAALFACAAGGFSRRGRLDGNAVLPLLAGGAILLAAARLYYLALPSVSPETITPGEGLWALALMLILAAAVRKNLEIRAALMRAVAMTERRRVAEDLHDGLAQDLAFIAAHGAQMAEQLGGEHPLTVAARRALELSRATITELSDMTSTPPREELEAIAHELRGRFRIGIAVDVHPEAELAPETREQIARIAREAIANAARHGGARNVLVSLRPTNTGIALRVFDDGRGISRPSAVGSGGGIGLRSMQDRAAAVGGHLTLRERSAGGTELQVVIP
jgi:signal transduction histidine kinase